MAYFSFIFTITCSALTKTVRYKATQNLQKKTMVTLFNELFTPDDQDANGRKLEQYAAEIGVTIR